MKTTHAFIMALGLLVLSACSDGSSKSSSGGNYTGNKADINGAKKLVKAYQDSSFYFEKGYVSYGKVKGNLLWAETYVGFADDYLTVPQSYYAMRYVGCIGIDGKEIPSEQDKHTQMDVVVGAYDALAIYVQSNSLNQCYLGQVNWGSHVVVNGQVYNTNSRNRGVIGLPTDSCQDYQIDQALVRIPKDAFEDSFNNASGSNYWNYRSYWKPDKDYYYDVKDNRYGQFTGYNVVTDASEDSFGKINDREAVFVTKSIRSKSSGSDCTKDVYWGFIIDSLNPPEIQVLGRN